MSPARELYLGHSTLPYLSALRVYLPLNYFTEAEQQHINQDAPPSSNRLITDFTELKDSLRRVLTADDPFSGPAMTDRVRTLQMDDGEPLLFNLSQTKLRSAAGMVAFHSSAGQRLSELLWEEETLDQATGLAADAILTLTRTSNWGIPMGWFALISESDRTEVVESKNRIITVRVQVKLPEALTRLEHAISVLQENAPDLDLIDDLLSLQVWLTSFAEFGEAVLELDYGPVADRVYPDESPTDVKLGIEAIGDGDPTSAAAAYRRLVTRWIPIRQLGRAS